MDRPNTFLSSGGKERVLFVGRQHHQGAARPQDVKRLLHHVDFQLALAALRRGVEHGLEVGRQVPEIGGRYDLCREAALPSASSSRPAW